MEDIKRIVEEKGEELTFLSSIITKALKRKNKDLECLSVVGLQYGDELDGILILHLSFEISLRNESFNQIKYSIKYNKKTLEISSIIEEIEDFKSDIIASLIFTLDSSSIDKRGNILITKDLRNL